MQIFSSCSLAQHVEQHHRQRVDAAQPGRVADRHGIEPAAAPRPPGDRAVFVAPVANVLADLVVLLGRKRPAADARRIGLHHADHLVDPAAGHARAAGHADARAVAAGDERERAVVDVEQCPLGAFEQDSLARFDRVEQIGRRVGDERLQPLGVALVLAGDLSRRRTAVAAWPARRRVAVLGLGDVLELSGESLSRYKSPRRTANERPTLSR